MTPMALELRCWTRKMCSPLFSCLLLVRQVLKTRTDSLQAQQDRRSQFLSASTDERRSSQLSMSDQASPSARRLSHSVAGGGDSVAIDLGSGSAGTCRTVTGPARMVQVALRERGVRGPERSLWSANVVCSC